MEVKDSATATVINALALSHRNNDDYMGWIPGYFANMVQLSKDVSIAFASDGVGFKTNLAHKAKDYRSIGYDCLAACVNDLICVGAEPVAFLNYIHMSEENTEVLKALGESFKNASMDSRINILGGETSIYPNTQSLTYDVSGTAIGKMMFKTPITGNEVRQGNIIIGLHSSGIHCNGITRAVQSFTLEDMMSVDPILKERVIDVLLTPTKCYATTVMRLFTGGIKPTGIVNVSGGGVKNMLRLRTKGIQFILDNIPELPDIFKVIRLKSELRIEDMINIFNMGIGMYLIIQQDEVEKTLKILDNSLDSYSIIGRVEAGDIKRVRWIGKQKL